MTKTSTVFFTALLALAVTTAAAARADKLSDEVNGVLQAVFLGLETQEDGVVRPRESDRMIRLTFSAMDVNQDQRITPDEFKAFDMGFGYLALVHDKLASFNAAKANIFQRWATGNPEYLTLQEYTAGIKTDLTNAASRSDTEGSKLSIDDFKNVRFIRDMIQAIR